MKLTSKVFALVAFCLIASTGFAARAEVQPGFPVQVEIEARQIVATHRLNTAGCMMNMMAEESIAPAILFPTASSALTKTASVSVKKAAALLKSPAYKGKHIMVNGYTDDKGKAAANQRLSYHRAVTVLKQLVKLGVPAKNLTAQGFGAESPVADNATAAGRAANRRVTLTLGN